MLKILAIYCTRTYMYIYYVEKIIQVYIVKQWSKATRYLLQQEGRIPLYLIRFTARKQKHALVETPCQQINDFLQIVSILCTV